MLNSGDKGLKYYKNSSSEKSTSFREKPNDLKKRPTAQLTSRCCISYIYSTNIRTENFKHAV